PPRRRADVWTSPRDKRPRGGCRTNIGRACSVGMMPRFRSGEGGVRVPPELEEVVGGGDELPFAVHGGHAATGEASDAAVVFGLAEHGLDRRGSLLVEPPTAGCRELRGHRDRWCRWSLPRPR